MVWILIVMFWTHGPNNNYNQFSHEFATHEECSRTADMLARMANGTYDTKPITVCMQVTKTSR